MMRKTKKEKNEGAFIQEQIAELEKESLDAQKIVKDNQKDFASNVNNIVDGIYNISSGDDYFHQALQKIDADRIFEQEELQKQQEEEIAKNEEQEKEKEAKRKEIIKERIKVDDTDVAPSNDFENNVKDEKPSFFDRLLKIL